MRHLYEISEDMKDLKAMLDDPEMEVAVIDTLEAIKAEFDEKAENIVIADKILKGEEDAIAKEIRRLSAMKSACKNKRESMREYLRLHMDEHNVKSIKLKRIHGSITRSAGRDTLAIDDSLLIPAEYQTTDVTITTDKAAVMKAIEDGEEIKGCHIENGRSIITFR